MGNIIGIKLADGSFYPVMEEGKPFSKKLELTTVRDDQTTVHLDLYRSATGSMDDAEYVDTLVVENLVPHPKQEHSLNLNIKLDENNMLSAEIDDPETGAISNSKVSLVTLKKEDLAAEPDYSITPEENVENFDEIDEIIDENVIDNLNDFEESDKLPEEIDIEVPSNFSDSEPTFLGENLSSEEDFLVEDDTSDLNNDFVFPEEIENLEESDNFDTKDAMILGGVGAAAVAGAVLADNLSTTEEIPTIEEDVIEEPQSFQEDSQLEEIDILVPEETSESAVLDDFALPSADTEVSSESAELDDFAFPADTEISSESAVLDDFAFPSADTEVSSESAEMDDFAFPADTEATSESAVLDDFAFPSADTEVSNESAELDDFAFPSTDTEISSESAVLDDFAFPSADTEISSESAEMDALAFPSADTEETSESAEMDDFAFSSADTEISSESAELDDFAFSSADTEVSSESAVLDDFALPSADSEISSESAELDDFAFPSADTEETSESAEMDDFAFPSADTEETSESAVLDDFAFPSADTEISSESAEMDDFALPSADTEETSESAELDDFAFPADSEISSESAELEDSAFSVADSELPNFDDFDIDSEESFEMEDNAPFTFDSLPEFDEIPELKDNSTDFSDDFAAMDFELPEIDESKYEFAASNEGGDPLFDSLYEENYKETEKSQKKTTIPVVICVICALICLGVLGIILWLTKPNLFGKKDAEPTVTIPVENVETELPVLEKEDLTSAKENEIVITPEPVVPEIPEPKVEVAPAKVIYRIKWGDTLWDLAESYYQNPWLYPKIAKANNIKNPDVIISGTDIEIPPLN